MCIRKSMAFFLVSLLFCILFVGCIAKPTESGNFKTKELTWALGVPLPSAKDFLESVPEGAEISFADKDPFSKLQAGENILRISCKPKDGRKEILSVHLNLINDNTPPVFHGVQDLIVYIGEGVSYRSGITLTDNCDGNVQLHVNTSSVDTANEGVYPVIYTATDLAGNTSTAYANVHVYALKITEEMLYAKIDPLIASLGLYSMSKQDQARAIYRFVHTDAKITYVDTSDKTSWVREAYFALENRKGDCFSYFALSKAFFERLGIPNKDIQRLPGYTVDTHYWSLINIGDAQSPQWYHYDATRVNQVPYEASLLTDAQIQAFNNKIRPNFYLYDQTKYPVSATKVLISRPDLE